MSAGVQAVVLLCSNAVVQLVLQALYVEMFASALTGRRLQCVSTWYLLSSILL